MSDSAERIDAPPLVLVGGLLVAVVLIAVLVWFLLGPPPEGPMVLLDSDASAGPPPQDEAAHQTPEDHGHGHDEDERLPSPDLTPDLEARIAEAMEHAGIGHRVDCIPDPPTFRPPPPAQLFEDSFVVAPTPLPSGGFRMEVMTRRGFRGLHDHGYTQGLVEWDLDATPPCRVRPTPSRYVVDTIPDWEPDLEAWACKQQLAVEPDGRVDEEVNAGYDVFYPEGRDDYHCLVRIFRGREELRRGIVSMQGTGPARFQDWEEMEPDPPPETLEEKVERLRGELADARAGEGRVDHMYRERLAKLRRLMDEDPELEAALEPRYRALEERMRSNRESYLESMEGWLTDAEDALAAQREGAVEDTGG